MTNRCGVLLTQKSYDACGSIARVVSHSWASCYINGCPPCNICDDVLYCSSYYTNIFCFRWSTL